ncbi:NapD protein [Catenovulum agarivorans DS-2]|uniref:Chaperone NapD n=1 Tax=Catenovulum agarivorans DS-2 TaxID=1328313 RepID=W7QW39_9ALTE|nr:chaperone NapD [Catenovulum agarivorans]EWH11963.1 NapD protein [Catenovulum agarivorans DS-2]
MNTEWHIASFIIRVQPDLVDRAISELNQIEHCELHGQDDVGQLVVTLEAPSAKSMANSAEQFQQLTGLLHAVPVYHEYLDNDLNNELNEQS